jgi:hypothetical protein
LLEGFRFQAVNESHFSNWRRLVRAITYVRRFIALKTNRYTRNFTTWLTACELGKSEEILIRKAQYDEFTEEFCTLLAGGKVQPKSTIYLLSPIMSTDGVIRMDSRIQKSPGLSYQTKNPAILPKKHYITQLIVKNYHERFLHAGQETILAALRQRYWIVNVRSVLKRIKKLCQHCKNRVGKPDIPQMGQLPFCRLTPFEKPFTYTGVDIFGPVQVTVKHHHEKRYGVIFVCMVTRAIHIEVANNLSADAFMITLRNFLFRRGPCAHIWSDNGTNLVGASRELKSAAAEMKWFAAEKAAELEITWHFNPASAPHFGGAPERLIQTVTK